MTDSTPPAGSSFRIFPAHGQAFPANDLRERNALPHFVHEVIAVEPSGGVATRHLEQWCRREQSPLLRVCGAAPQDAEPDEGEDPPVLEEASRVIVVICN